MKYEKLLHVVRCPSCRGTLQSEAGDLLLCQKCSGKYPIEQGIPVLLDPKIRTQLGDAPSFRVRLPSWIRRIKTVLEPPGLYCDLSYDKIFKRYLHPLFGSSKIILHIGSKTRNLAQNVINIDIDPYEGVDLLCDAHNLAFNDETVDCVYIPGVLEHLNDPDRCVEEIYRVLKKDGLVVVAIPFLQGYHPDPADYRRATLQGIEKMCSKFTNIESGVAGGPTSTLCWILQEYFSILFSFNNKYIHRSLKLLLGWILFPLKFLDYLFVGNKFAHYIAAGVYFIGKKDC